MTAIPPGFYKPENLTTVRLPHGTVVHARATGTPVGPKTLCGRYGDPRGGRYDLRPGAEDRVTCTSCLAALDADHRTRETVVPGHVVRVRWWNGRKWWTTHEARPA